MRRITTFLGLLLFFSVLLLAPALARADGTETLGPPSIQLATGTGIVAAGTGLEIQPGTINIEVPADATVKQVLLYWSGGAVGSYFPDGTPGTGDDTVTVNGQSVTGTLIGGPSYFYGNLWFSTYRADITGLNLVEAGANALTVTDMYFSSTENNGAGVLVIYDDGSAKSEIQLRDGLDLAFINFPPPRQGTVPQTFTFAPAPFDRPANLAMFFGSVSDDGLRPSSIEVTIDGTVTKFSNLLGSNDGPQWDTVSLPNDPVFQDIIIPAGASSLTVQAFSRDDFGDGQVPLAASFTWTATALGVLPPGSIGDTVYEDTNGNGVQDAGEPGIPGVVVELKNPGEDGVCGTADDMVLASETTDANGNYLFDGLRGGTYCVDPDETTVPAGYTLTTNNDPQTVDLGPGETFLDADFGYRPSLRLTLGDRVWYDQNQNGIQDPNEPGYNGIAVDLYNNATCSGTPIASTTTATGPAGFGDGYYQFTDLPAGTYCVAFHNIPAGWEISPANQGNGTNDSKPDPATGRILNINLTADDPDEDMGIYVAGSLGDSVVCASTGEGLANITVTLFEDFDGDGTADGPAIATTETDANGFYQFAGLEVALAGDANNTTNYIVRVDTNDPDLGTCDVPTPPTVYNPPLDSDNPNDPNNDFTFTEEPATVGDRVWFDNDGDGLQDAGEDGIPGVTVNLTDCSGNVLATEMTDANGNYLFEDLAAGTYCVVIDETTLPDNVQQTFEKDGTLDGDTQQPLNAGETVLDVDFGYQPVGAIGDTVYEDTNGNGVQDAGEPGIPGVTVDLNKPGPDGVCGTADDVLIASETTDANGNYLFDGLGAGVYCVDPDENTVPAGYTLTTNNDPQTVDLGPGETFLDADFGYRPPRLTLGDRVWYDQDQDGIQDPNEPGYNGATVDLYDNATCSGTPIASTTTAAGPAGFGDGYYQFGNLAAGTYCVQFGNIPAGWAISPADQGDGTNDSKANGSAQIPGISLTSNDPNEDMGIYVAGSLGDSVVCASTGEGLANITVTLFEDFDGNGTADGPAIATTETDANGFYQFTGLEVALAGDANNLTQYIVRVDVNDADLGVCDVPDGPTEYNPPLDSDNPNDPDNDFTFTEEPATVGDRVWFDNDGDGVQDAGENGIPGVTVNLTDCAGNVLASDTTDANGNYLFDGLAAGTYCVVIDEATLPDNVQQTFEKDGSLNGDTEQPLAPGDTVLDVDFGYQPLGSIGDTVYEDTNGNGVQDAGEPGIPGVTVDLNEPGPDGVCGTADDVFIASDTTDANGNYLFDGLPQGIYCVDPDENTVPAGYTLTTNNDPETVDLGPGETFLDADFGYQPPQPTATVGDRVWFDNDGDGVQDAGEGGIPGVTVNLTDCSGNVLDSATTDANGNYLFDGLAAGTYCVVVDETTLPGNVQQTFEKDGTLDGDTQQPLNAGETVLDVDFGYQPLGSIGDTVFEDTNGNGVQDAGEPGIPGVTVDLTCAGPDGVFGTADDIVDTAVTDANGNYLFTGLPAGVCEVNPDETTVPPGYTLTTNNDPQTVDLGPGETFLDADFGYRPPLLLTLGDRVWYDQNQNGIQDPNEPGYNGATVDLYDNANCAGSPVASTTTATGPAGFGDGYYQFSGLEAGDYCIQFGNIPAGWSISPPNEGIDDTADSDANGNARIPNINLTADDADEDMGIYVAGSLGDSVVCASTGEGLANITVTLFADFDGDGTADGPAIATTETDANGFYQFSGLEVALAGDANNTTNYIVRVDTNDPDLGACNLPVPPTEYNPPLDSDNPNDPNNDFTFEEPLQAAINVEKYTLVVTAQGGSDLCDTYGKPQVLTMRYTGDNVNDNSQDPGKVSISGDPMGATPVRIVASEKENGGGKIYFNGTRNLDETFAIDARNAGDSELRSETWVTIYDLNGNVLQSIKFHTSCSQPLILGDQFGSIQLVGFQDKNGGGDSYTPPADLGEDADTPPGPTATVGDQIRWTYLVTNPGDVALTDVTVSDDNGTPADSGDDFAPAPVEENGVNVGDSNGDGRLDPGEEWRYQATGTAQLGQYANLGTARGTSTFDGAAVSDTDPSHYVGEYTGADLCDTYGKPQILTMLYTGNNVNDNAQDPGKVSITGDPMGASPVLIIASEKENGGGKIYFSGEVAVGETFVIDAKLAGDDELRSETWVTIYDLNGNVLQSIKFHTSCSQPLALGDQFGGIQLVGFQDKNGGGEGEIPPGAEVRTDLCETYGKPQILTMRYTGDNVIDNYQDPGKVSIVGDPMGASPVLIIASEKENGGGKIYFDGTVNVGETFVIDAKLAGDDELRSETFVTVYDLNGNVLQSIKFHTSCSQPLTLDDQFGSIQLVGFQDKNGGGEGEIPPGAEVRTDLCETYGKPQILTMRYTGDNVNDNAQDSGKVSITGDPMGASPVRIVASEKENGGGKIYFNGQVNVGETFAIDARLAGDSELRSETWVTIYDLNGNVLQSIKFHTSCSQPLRLEDQFGGIQLVGFADKNGNGDQLAAVDGTPVAVLAPERLVLHQAEGHAKA